MPLYYTWDDIDRASARMANLLGSLDLPDGSRVAVQVEKSVEALLLYLATLRAGLVFAAQHRLPERRDRVFHRRRRARRGGARRATSAGSARLPFTGHGPCIYTLGDDRTGSLLDRAAHHGDTHEAARKGPDDLAAILYTSGTTGAARAPCSRTATCGPTPSC